MNKRKTVVFLATTFLLVVPFIGKVLPAPAAAQATPQAGPSRYRLLKNVSIGGEGGWDYAITDAPGRRIYVSHDTRVIILDADTQEKVGDVPGTRRIHGIALAREFGRGYISNGATNNITVFDLKSLKTLGVIPAGTNPDAIVYDEVSKRVFAMNGRSGDITAIDAVDDKTIGSVAIGGKLEFAAADGKGAIFVNLEDKSELVRVDARKLTVLDRWPLAPCSEPSGLAMDTVARRLFVACGNQMMAVVNADTGKVVATLPSGEGTDAAAFDPETRFAFASNGEGTLTVVHEDSPDKFSLVENVPTKRSARTMSLDLKTHNIFLPAADFDPPAPGEQRGKMKPDSFQLLMLTR